jgi:hypothetical protein
MNWPAVTLNGSHVLWNTLPQKPKKPVLPIIQCEFDQEHRVSDDEFAGAILNALDAPSQGVIIFNYKALAAAKQARILSSAWR